MQAEEIRSVYEVAGFWGLSVVAVSALTGAILVARATKKAEAIAGKAVAKELEAHKVQLQIGADAARLDIQRQLHDFTLYSSRRMDAYEKVYRSVIRAEGAAGANIGKVFERDYSRASADQIRSEFAQFNLPREELDDLISLWNQDRKRAIVLFEQLKMRVLLGRAERLYSEAVNRRLLDDLYLSSAVSSALDKAMPEIWRLISALRYPDLFQDEAPVLLKHRAAAAVIDVRNAMQQDLARGDYGRTFVNSLTPLP